MIPSLVTVPRLTAIPLVFIPYVHFRLSRVVPSLFDSHITLYILLVSGLPLSVSVDFFLTQEDVGFFIKYFPGQRWLVGQVFSKLSILIHSVN